MKLAKKTFLYSILLSVIIVCMVVGYFIFLFPSLYVNHIRQNNLDSAVALQEQYVKERSYSGIKVKNPTGTITVDIPLAGNEITIVNKFIKGTVTFTDKDFIEILDKFRTYAKNPDQMKEGDNWIDTSLLLEKVKAYRDNLTNLPFTVTWESTDSEKMVWDSDVKIHRISDDFYISEANVSQGESNYTNYLAMTVTNDSIVVSFLSVVTPEMKDVMPVVLQSLPMIVAVVFLLVLLLSQLFSKWIITPIIKLSRHAESVKRVNNLEIMPLALTGNDEITSLGRNLNALYEKLREHYKELEDRNTFLSKENERQEVFMRAFSHQLKTPIAAALLLVQGMYEEIGKYKDTKLFLPKVKEQLNSMQKIVEDILYLNHCSFNSKMETVLLDDLVSASVSNLEVPINERTLQVTMEGFAGVVKTDAEMLKMILDNLLSNAVTNTPQNGQIKIIKTDKKIQIINYGVTIKEEILPHIFEPFVSGNNKQKGHGLGLYIVKYYAQYLDCEVTVDNVENGVEAVVEFR